jgi:hypothetical protein
MTAQLAVVWLAILALVAVTVRDAERAIIAGFNRIGSLAIHPARATMGNHDHAPNHRYD